MNLHTTSLTIASLRAELEARPERINEKGYSGMTPLMFACWKSPEKARYLIEKGADVNIRNNAEASAIHYACRSGHLDVIEMLIDAGADIDVIDRTGMSPLMEACMKAKLDVATLLLQRGAGLNLKNVSGNTAVTYLSKESDKLTLQNFVSENSGTIIRSQ